MTQRKELPAIGEDADRLFRILDDGISPQARHDRKTAVLTRWGINDPDGEAITALAGGPVW